MCIFIACTRYCYVLLQARSPIPKGTRVVQLVFFIGSEDIVYFRTQKINTIF